MAKKQLVASIFASSAFRYAEVIVRPLIILVLMTGVVLPTRVRAATGSPSTTAGNATCDIAVTPAATLLLPFFEVDLRSASTSAINTIFTVVNTAAAPQIAHVTVWTDWAEPVLVFNIFLPGYDVQGVNLRDVLVDGILPPLPPVPNLTRAIDFPGYPYRAEAAVTCFTEARTIPDSLRLGVQTALTTGDYSRIDPTCIEPVGGTHANATGYITIDVTNRCSQTFPTSERYYLDELLYDNVLIGDYQHIDPVRGTSGGETLVHIRAIPEGGPAASEINLEAGGSLPYSQLPFTFYDRYVPELYPRIDRRQPLPAVFSGRYINGTSSGFATKIHVWRETVTGSRSEGACDETFLNSQIPFAEIIRFDESENPTILVSECRLCACYEPQVGLPASASTTVDDDGDGVLPPDTAATAHAGGWLYLNLNHGIDIGTFAADRAVGASQNWVTMKISGEGRYGAMLDAAMLGNGCSPAPMTAARPIGPVGGVCNPLTNPLCRGINATPNPVEVTP